MVSIPRVLADQGHYLVAGGRGHDQVNLPSTGAPPVDLGEYLAIPIDVDALGVAVPALASRERTTERESQKGGDPTVIRIIDRRCVVVEAIQRRRHQPWLSTGGGVGCDPRITGPGV